MTPDDVHYLVVHTAAFSGRNCDADVIRKWHTDPPRNWSDIGYHYVIINDKHDELEDGTVQEGRPAFRQGAHVRGINGRSLGICCVGHGDREPHTAAQRESLLGLLSDLMDTHPNVMVDRVIGHREINDLVEAGVVGSEYRTTKTCPGTLVDMDEIREQLRARRRGAPVADAEAEAPSDDEIREALDVLRATPAARFPNASDELRLFLTHPEVRSFEAEHG